MISSLYYKSVRLFVFVSYKSIICVELYFIIFLFNKINNSIIMKMIKIMIFKFNCINKILNNMFR